MTDKKPRTKIGSKLKTALDLMVFGDSGGLALDYPDAARTAGFTTRAMRKALDKPHVRAYLLEKKQVLRATIGAKTLSRLAQLRDQDENRNAAVAAARELERQESITGPFDGVPRAPGLVVQIIAATALPSPPLRQLAGIEIDGDGITRAAADHTN